MMTERDLRFRNAVSWLAIAGACLIGVLALYVRDMERFVNYWWPYLTR
jgi:hypothetical protein